MPDPRPPHHPHGWTWDSLCLVAAGSWTVVPSRSSEGQGGGHWRGPPAGCWRCGSVWLCNRPPFSVFCLMILWQEHAPAVRPDEARRRPCAPAAGSVKRTCSATVASMSSSAVCRPHWTIPARGGGWKGSRGWTSVFICLFLLSGGSVYLLVERCCRLRPPYLASPSSLLLATLLVSSILCHLAQMPTCSSSDSPASDPDEPRRDTAWRVLRIPLPSGSATSRCPTAWSHGAWTCPLASRPSRPPFFRCGRPLLQDCPSRRQRLLTPPGRSTALFSTAPTAIACLAAPTRARGPTPAAQRSAAEPTTCWPRRRARRRTWPPTPTTAPPTLLRAGPRTRR